MRIETRLVSAKDKLKKGKVIDKADGKFVDTLNQIENEAEIDFDLENVQQKDLKKLADLISKFGENLSQNPTPDNFNQYKKYIKLFITALQNNFEVKDTISRITFTKQKLYKTIENIDSNLSELAIMILSNEKNRLNFLKLVNSIKGLIIDLIL